MNQCERHTGKTKYSVTPLMKLAPTPGPYFFERGTLDIRDLLWDFYSSFLLYFIIPY